MSGTKGEENSAFNTINTIIGLGFGIFGLARAWHDIKDVFT